MRNIITTNNLNVINNQVINSLVKLDDNSPEPVKNNSVAKIFATEGYESFNKYIELLGLDKESNLLVLSSLHHYYYDAEEMVNIKTIVNIKELNKIKQLKDFLHSIFHILPAGSYFIGCFVNNKQNGFALYTNSSDYYYRKNVNAIENGIASNIPFLNMIYNMIDSKTNKYMSDRSVRSLLVEHGFKVLDMTELDGLTYFCAQSLRTSDNK